MGAAFALAAFASPALAEDAPDCRLTLYASLDMLPGDPHRILVPVTLNGHNETLIVDTGTPFSMLTESAVNALGLPRQMLAIGAEYQMLTGAKVDDMAVVSSFQLGDMKGKDFRFGVLPGGMLEDGLPGLLGADIVRNYDVEFDFAANKMNLFSPHHCTGKVIYWTHQPYASVPFHFDRGHHIVIPITLDNVALTAVVDTGAPTGVSMNIDTARDLFGWRTDPPELRHVAGPSSPQTYPFALLSLGGASVHNPSSNLRATSYGSKIDVLVGLEALKAFHVYISYEDQKIYLTARDAH